MTRCKKLLSRPVFHPSLRFLQTGHSSRKFAGIANLVQTFAFIVVCLRRYGHEFLAVFLDNQAGMKRQMCGSRGEEETREQSLL
jgi:hypothetical protein